MADGIGNIAVIIASLTQLLATGSWTAYMDPAMSVLIACIVVNAAIPLVRSTSSVLLQGVPSFIGMDKIRKGIEELNDVVTIKNLHVWGLTDTEAVASVHLVLHHSVQDSASIVKLTKQAKDVLESNGISSNTIEVSFDAEPVNSHGVMILDEIENERPWSNRRYEHLSNSEKHEQNDIDLGDNHLWKRCSHGIPAPTAFVNQRLLMTEDYDQNNRLDRNYTRAGPVEPL
ncbi:hypothetical protein HDU67_009470 [Dinochytrium kinnereticum]|nr:hypothetical protein HDU67_009470 [Dinochytrium kinnereticum]